MCENSSFEKMATISIILIQFNYFDYVINEFNLIDLEITVASSSLAFSILTVNFSTGTRSFCVQ